MYWRFWRHVTINRNRRLVLRQQGIREEGESAVILPRRYTDIYKMDSFVTHNFATEVKIEMNNTVLYQKTINKADFNSVLHPEEKKYGVLFCPSMRRLNDTIRLRYSISIRLTDVGVGVTMKISKNGTVSYMR